MTFADGMNASEPNIDIEPGLRKMILIEIIFPMVLLILGIYHGLMQVLYRAGMIRSSQFLGLSYFQGLTIFGWLRFSEQSFSYFIENTTENAN